MNGPSEHLSWKELACHDGTEYPKRFINDGRVFKLAAAFEGIRHVCGDKPIHILSAYRTPEWNRKIGGAPASQHMQGRALDLRPPGDMKVIDFFKIIKENHIEFQINGMGLYVTFVHVDIRETNKLVAWSSSAPKELLT